ncbi:hypothetical protein [Lysobacter silvisoli]|uniref:Uncharacterized protein n=1 Tax=Lysobacter silvisoli TaxID=2293254 RepID=A0A371JWP2_9GAMM|nr:hypothetical protein [Lysobacter silvisoli]RDZ26007.1 hypothetical protein DX914_19290 [Lysobacter silvisoli]
MVVRGLWLLLAIAVGAPLASAYEKVALPSDPSTWGGDLLERIQPTPACAGGTVEQLGKRLAVSEPYSAAAFERTHGKAIGFKRELADTDRVHAFSFRSERPGESYWGFDGVLVARGGCVIHARITNYDN